MSDTTKDTENIVITRQKATENPELKKEVSERNRASANIFQRSAKTSRSPPLKSTKKNNFNSTDQETTEANEKTAIHLENSNFNLPTHPTYANESQKLNKKKSNCQTLKFHQPQKWNRLKYQIRKV